MKKDGRTIDSLISKLEEPVEATEFRMNILADDYKSFGMDVIEKMHKYINLSLIHI